MRELLFSSLLAAGMVGERVYATGTLGFQGIPADPDYPYILVNSLQPRLHKEVWKTGRSKTHNFQVFVYDEIGSFVRIDDILRQVQETVLGLTLEVSPSGARCTHADWTGESADLTDSEKKQNTKYGLASLVSNE